MFVINSNSLYFLPIAVTLLFTNNVIADNQSQQKKTIYKVDFYNTNTKTQNVSPYETNTTNNENPELKILLLNKGHALVLEPGAMANTKLKYGETERSLQSEVTELENQGIKYIICEPPATNSNNKNVYSTNISNTTSASELTRLRAMGYKCVKP